MSRDSVPAENHRLCSTTTVRIYNFYSRLGGPGGPTAQANHDDSSADCSSQSDATRNTTRFEARHKRRQQNDRAWSIKS